MVARGARAEGEVIATDGHGTPPRDDGAVGAESAWDTPVSSDASPHFRPDIEGLRAVAILAVLAYHAGIPWLPGGFVGVDVFFVISGFLITGLLLRERDGADASTSPASTPDGRGASCRRPSSWWR